MDHRNLIAAKRDPFASQIRILFEISADVLSKTVKSGLVVNNLIERSLRKIPLSERSQTICIKSPGLG